MQIDVSSIKSSKGASMKLNLSESFEFFNTHLGELEFKEPIVLEGTISNKGDNFLLNATIKTTISLKCNRCYKPVARVIDLPIEEIFSNNAVGKDEEIWAFAGNIIELNPVIISNIALDIPMKVLCSDDCKGLCPKCGHDLNESDCGCDMTEIDPRFEKLWSLFKDEEV
jgi:uncharacterized protein